MATWRHLFADLSNQQLAALEEERLDILMDVNDRIAQLVHLHTAAGKPQLHEEATGTEPDNFSLYA